MKGKILMLGMTAGLLPPASAQSSVTLYGLLDAGYVYQKTDGYKDRHAIDSGNVSGSRWGLRGSEDLGNGLTALFLLEGGVDIDTGTQAQGGSLFGRWAYVGLRGGFGEVRLGLHRNFGYDWGAAEASPFGAAWSNAAAGRTLGYRSGDFGPNGGRLQNSAFYVSPSFGGFQAGVGYSFSANADEQAGTKNNNRVLSAGLRYRNGPLRGALTYEKLRATEQIATRKDASNLQAALNYDFGPLRLYGAYGRVEDGNGGIFAGHDKVDSYTVGASIPVGKGSILTSWQKAKQARVDGHALAYLHPLSKRTDLYGFYNKLTDDDVDTRQVSFGVRHRF
ncbi:porin [Pseudothauera rhizosphaerae]|uniref:Porin n=1 Tax=Pseudothauera rhizosphaerae TaxID=2565932 RepID=A0A4S4ADX0_9RHOO|nr:porin [Pseudothauera rhizosphaerae]THF57210.1 porin [Pseudothauera rhizosphaerae]